MKKALVVICILLSLSAERLAGQHGEDTLVYLLTCGPGTESYSVYGHSALRIKYKELKRDWVYNWGIFDFETPNFGWKFANGNLQYMLAVESMHGFVQTYFTEKRSVISQQLNLTHEEKTVLLGLIAENLKPQNVKYRYDFFYDNCSTRIRDLIEKAIGKSLLYLPDTEAKKPTFRSLVAGYQQTMPWLKFGIDLLLGAPVDRGASYRDKMFLPDYLQKELSEAVINRDGKMIPLLQNPEQLLESNIEASKPFIFFNPEFVFVAIFILVLILSARMKGSKTLFWLDMAIFTIFSLLALLMIFFNFFSGHPQLRMNLNMIWISPLIVVCLILLILKKKSVFWFRLLFYVLALFMVIQFILPQTFNIANIPLLLILITRSSARADFEWNPL